MGVMDVSADPALGPSFFHQVFTIINETPLERAASNARRDCVLRRKPMRNCHSDLTSLRTKRFRLQGMILQIALLGCIGFFGNRKTRLCKAGRSQNHHQCFDGVFSYLQRLDAGGAVIGAGQLSAFEQVHSHFSE